MIFFIIYHGHPRPSIQTCPDISGHIRTHTHTRSDAHTHTQKKQWILQIEQGHTHKRLPNLRQGFNIFQRQVLARSNSQRQEASDLATSGSQLLHIWPVTLSPEPPGNSRGPLRTPAPRRLGAEIGCPCQRRGAATSASTSVCSWHRPLTAQTALESCTPLGADCLSPGLGHAQCRGHQNPAV